MTNKLLSSGAPLPPPQDVCTAPDLMNWARRQGCPWDEQTCWAAATSGNLEVLQMARSLGCPWDGRTCMAAARHGRLEVQSSPRDLLSFPLENNCCHTPNV